MANDFIVRDGTHALASATHQILRDLLPRRAIDELQQAVGMLEYIKTPAIGVGWGPFNGQSARQVLFVEIAVKTQPRAVVETGTARGSTTEFFSRTGLPVFTIELQPRYYGFARARFWRQRNVKSLRGDSREALRRLFAGPLHALCSCTIFFYLDAHGHMNGDLPLAEELDIVFNQCPPAVVMIDDFEVPTDPGYGYDDYGPGKALVAAYIRPAIAAHELRAFYPSTPAAADYPSTLMAAAGYADPARLRRGCIVLVKGAYHGPVLASLPLLRPAAETEL